MGTILMLLHPSLRDESLEQQRTRTVLDAIAGYIINVIGPNNDPGHRGILQAYKHGKVPVAMSVAQEHFWSVLTQARVLVGNSSSGILEAATLGVAVVNVGDRQMGRERNLNILDVPWSAGKSGIQKAIHFALGNKNFIRKVEKRQNLYGDGHAGERIVKSSIDSSAPLPTVKKWHDR